MKYKYVWGFPLLIFVLFGFFSIIQSSNLDNFQEPISDQSSYEGFVYTYTTGDFEGRISEPHVGISELVGGSHNLLTTAGQNAIKEILGQNTDYGAFDYIALCNATAGCTAPNAGDTTLDNEYVAAGLSRAQGTYASISDGFHSITYTFTATSNNQEVNMTGLFNQSLVAGSVMLAENTFTLVTLQSADQLTTNWTVNSTDGS